MPQFHTRKPTPSHLVRTSWPSARVAPPWHTLAAPPNNTNQHTREKLSLKTRKISAKVTSKSKISYANAYVYKWFCYENVPHATCHMWGMYTCALGYGNLCLESKYTNVLYIFLLIFIFCFVFGLQCAQNASSSCFSARHMDQRHASRFYRCAINMPLSC